LQKVGAARRAARYRATRRVAPTIGFARLASGAFYETIVTPVETGVQTIYNYLKKLDSGACPGPDPGFAGMTKNRISRPFTNSLRMNISKKCLLGVDLETGGCKIILLGPSDKILGSGSMEYNASHPQTRYADQKPEDWSKDLCYNHAKRARNESSNFCRPSCPI
jgi:hypothetical protein